jgi:cobalt-precorrin 5A hydrolase
LKIGIISFSAKGCDIAIRIASFLKDSECSLFSKSVSNVSDVTYVEGSVDEWTEHAFHTFRDLIFVSASGIAVRYVAPYLKSGAECPTVVCVDEGGAFAIALLSGHAGGGNELAKRISEGIGSTAVITTDIDAGGKFSIDTYAAAHDMHIGNPALAKEIMTHINRGAKICLKSEVPMSSIPPELDPAGSGDLGIFISYRTGEGPFKKTLTLTPRCHVLGMACRQNVSKGAVDKAVRSFLQDNDISLNSVKSSAYASKKPIPGVLAFCSLGNIDTGLFRAEGISGTGTKKCEEVAMKASGGGRLVLAAVESNNI